MRLLDKYIIFSSIFAMFTEDFSFHLGIDWKLFYLILSINFVLLVVKKSFSIHKNLFILLSFFLVHGIVMYLIKGNSITSLIAQLVGISFSSIYYYNLLKIYGTKVLFKEYQQIALYIAALALPMFFLNINVFTTGRLNGIMSEPAHYAALMLPALYVFFRQKLFLKSIVILVTIILSKSTIGFIGLFLILVIPLLKVKHFLKYSIIALIITIIGGYYISSKWNEKTNEKEGNVYVRRVKETKESLSAVYTGKFKKYTNLSSYALLSNTFITQNIFFQNPLGTGLGSYKQEYEKRYEKLHPPKYLVKLKQSKINSQDANSLFLRITADLGVFGLLIVLYFAFRSINLFQKDDKVIQQSAFFYLIVKLLREGHYFPPEFYFLTLVFLKDFDEDNTYS